MTIITRHPVLLDIAPGLTLPKDLAAADKAQTVAFEKWADAESELLRIGGDIDTARGEDTKALVAAVAAGEPHPGTPAENEHRRAVEYAAEVERQAFAAFDLAREKVEAALKAHALELLPQAIANARAGIEAYKAEVAAVEERFTRIGNHINQGAAALQMLAPYTTDRLRYTIHTAPTSMTITPLSEVRGNIEEVATNLENIYFNKRGNGEGILHLTEQMQV